MKEREQNSQDFQENALVIIIIATLVKYAGEFAYNLLRENERKLSKKKLSNQL